MNCQLCVHTVHGRISFLNSVILPSQHIQMGPTWDFLGLHGLQLGMGLEWAFNWVGVGPHMGIPEEYTWARDGHPTWTAHMGTRWVPLGLYYLFETSSKFICLS